MVTMKNCNICGHPVDNHTYNIDEIDTAMGKQRCTQSNCNIEGCKCYEQSLERFKKQMVDQKEHG